MTMSIETISFWIRAFIPTHIDGLTVLIPKHEPLTMIPGPIPVISDCFHTDQRTFSIDKSASSRMYAEATVGFSGSVPNMTSRYRCDATQECDCEDGEIECVQVAGISGMSFTLASTSTDRVAILLLNCAANNPCVTPSPYINMQGTITIDIGARSVEFDGLVEPFPAFEAYATINHGTPVTLFAVDPLPGNTPWNLLFGANRTVFCRVSDLDGDGTFEVESTYVEP
jgi:hypothetical protein